MCALETLIKNGKIKNWLRIKKYGTNVNSGRSDKMEMNKWNKKAFCIEIVERARARASVIDYYSIDAVAYGHHLQFHGAREIEMRVMDLIMTRFKKKFRWIE